MARHIDPPPPGFSKPPGTVNILKENELSGSSETILQPTPSTDPNDPLNWTAFRKSVHFIPILAITVVIFTQTSIPLTFWVLWAPEFGWTYDQLNTAQAINYAGTAVGCVFFIPLAVKFGRRPVYIVTTAIIVATSAWQASMTTVTDLYISNLIFGLASATNETIVQMTVADLFFVHQRGTANSAYLVMVNIGSFLTPMASGVMAAQGNWRQCFWATFAVEVALLVYFAIFFEESKYICHIEAQRQSIDEIAPISASDKCPESKNRPLDPVVSSTSTTCHTPMSHDIPILSWKQRLRLFRTTDENMWKEIYQPFVILFKFPVVMYTALQYAFGLAWISAQASVISISFAQEPYNFGTVGISNMSLGPFIGGILGSIHGGFFSDKTVFWFARRNYGYYEPEMRLHILHLPALCVGGGLIMFGVTTAQGLHWIWPSIGGAIFGFGVGSICDVAITALIDSYREITGEAFVAVAFVRNLLSIGIFFVLVPWMNSQGTQNMFIQMGAIATVMAFIHVPLIWYGKRIREKTASQYNRLVQENGGRRI